MKGTRQQPAKRAPAEAIPNSLRRYVFDTIELKQSIEFNFEDNAFAEDPSNRIIYVFDADVAVMFLSPRDGVDSIDIFRVLSPDRKGPRDEGTRQSGQFEGLAELSAAVCAEYIFSRRLPGQHGAPARIGYHHALELESFLNRQVADSHVQWQQVEAELRRSSEDLKRKLKDQWGDLNAERQTPDEFVKLLTEVLPRELHEWMLVKGLAVRQFRRLVQTGQERLLPLQQLPNFKEEMDLPSPEAVDTWYDLIERHRGPAKQDMARGHSRRVQEDRNYRDATVLVQVQLLNEARAANEKFLFVTGSPSVHKAVAEWNDDHHSPDDKVDFVRHPRQYIALLNMRDMRRARSGQQVDHSVLAPLQSTVNDILKTFFAKGEFVPRDGYRISDLEASLRQKLSTFDAASESDVSAFAAQTERLRRQWADLTKAAVAYQRDALTDMCGPIFDVIEKIVEQRSVDLALVRQCENLVGSISKDNAFVGVLGSVATLLTKVQSTRNPVSFSRSPAWVRYNFRGLIEQGDTRDINAFLNDIIRDSGGRSFDRIFAWMKNTHARGQDAGDAYLLVGFIFLKMGDWALAIHFLEKAESEFSSIAGQSDALHEVRYCLAVAWRLRMTDEAHHESAQRLARLCLAYHTPRAKSIMTEGTHVFRVIRAQVELAAIESAWATIRLANLRAGTTATQKFGVAGELMREAQALLQKAMTTCELHFHEEPSEREHPRFVQVQTQLVTNMAGALTIREFLMDEEGAIRSDSNSKFVKTELGARIERDGGHLLTRLSYQLLVWKSEDDSVLALEAAASAKALLAKARADRNAHWTKYDEFEFQAVSAALDRAGV
jgi:hypothetical protein